MYKSGQGNRLGLWGGICGKQGVIVFEKTVDVGVLGKKQR